MSRLCTCNVLICVSYSPNAEEALSLLSISTEPTRELVEEACRRFLDMGVGLAGGGSVVIRSGAMGACVATRGSPCTWVDAFWTEKDSDKVVDVTGRLCVVGQSRSQLIR